MCMSVSGVGYRATGDDWRQTSGRVNSAMGRRHTWPHRPASQTPGSYQLVGGDLRQLPRLEVADVLPLLGNQDTGKADDVAAAILATAPTGAPGRIGRGTWALLRGDGCDRYPSRSEAEAAIMAGCVNAGLSFGAILGLFQTWPAAGKFAELHAQNPAAGYRVSAAHVGECRQVDCGASLGRAQAGVSGGAMGAVNTVAGSDGPHRPRGLSGARAHGVTGGQAGI